MSDSVITTLISSGFLLVGTIVTAVISVINGKTAKKTNRTIDDVEKKLDAHIKEDEWYNAKQMRIRIIMFYDDICSGVKYSENHYEEILEDIDNYERFCSNHPDYHNNKGKMAMSHIKSEYENHKKMNSFL